MYIDFYVILWAAWIGLLFITSFLSDIKHAISG